MSTIDSPGGLAVLMDIPTVAEHLGVTDRFVRRLVEERRIPFLKIGKYVRFDPREVERWMKRQAVDEARP